MVLKKTLWSICFQAHHGFINNCVLIMDAR